jgi:preprotein translocase subunit SecA
VLVGTLDVKQSEELAELLRTQGITASVLNAKNDDEEAAIIAEAGSLGSVTVSTQMAGRGVDIRLGDSKQSDYDTVAELGGLYVIGAGRHDSRRVDNQLRGRSGRQGDPGGSVFFISLEDDLIVRHAPDAIPSMPKMNMEGLVEDDQVDFAVEHAQRVAEGVAHEIHRNTWRYSVVIEQQRQQVAELRERLLTTEDAADLLMDQCVKADDLDRDVLVQVGRSIALYHLDRAWTDHLAQLADVREGVHLRALGRLDPLDEFHRAAVPLFNELIPAVEQKTIETFEDADIDENGWHPEESEIVRPSATWTYLVHENPFGSELDRLIAAVGRRLSSSR